MELMLGLVQHLLIVAPKPKSVYKLYCTVYECIHVGWEQVELAPRTYVDVRYEQKIA